MILLNKEKISVRGVDVYPDHSDPNQFWYVPGHLKLAQRGGKAVLSYIWYIDGADDQYGRGFLNFEVNAAVDNNTLEQIKSELKRVHPELSTAQIKLAAVTYNRGSVNFTALGPVVQTAPSNSPDPGIILQDNNQIVWNAGSSSLVGDNSAVCSIEFTKEGRLAAAMKAAIENKSNNISASYYLEFTGLRPSITFSVKGDLTVFMEDFKTSVGLPIPLDVLVLNIGFQNQFQASWQKTNMKIELIDYTGEGSDNLAWAQKIVSEYILKNFFEVQLKPGGGWDPLSEKPEIANTINKSDELREQGKDPKTSLPAPIPQVNINVSNYTGIQHNQLDFLYSEMKATTYPIAPQAAVLENLGNPNQYILEVNRNQDPFGLPYPVQVSGPSSSIFQTYGLVNATVSASYPAGNAPNNQQRHNVIFNPSGRTGENPMPFQYDSSGSSPVKYSVNYVFDPSSEWQADSYEYKLENNQTSTGAISALPGTFLDFLDIKVRLDSDFTWYDTDQAIVYVTSNAWSGTKTVIFQNDPSDSNKQQNLKLRLRSNKRDGAICQYNVELKNNGQTVYQYGPRDVVNQTITVYDQFQTHVKIVFYNGLSQNVNLAFVTVQYEDPDNNYAFESEPLTFESGANNSDKRQSVVIPTVKKYSVPSDLTFSYTVQTPDGEFSKQAQGGKVIIITGAQ